MGQKDGGLGPAAAGAVALGTVVGASLVGGRSSPTPDHPRTRRWYKDLEKPGFTPPAAVYGVAWTAIQAGLAVGGYRLLRRAPSRQRTIALSLWGVNQAAIAGWSEVFFGHRAPGAGTLAAGAMIGTAAGYVAAAAREDDAAAALGVPLVAWVSFATLLAEEIWRRNDPA
ncbi:TspO/MBR family protein [Lichenibacterium dinghuense]|uniref:TspO/MBR family protein n=1 Tax=Lichenibacterium dinghuense TaxID=2895977 RepID=UPI001F2C0A97|nr:TspO/MBR family protein [Lichenibacterium sp. 6Y81]